MKERFTEIKAIAYYEIKMALRQPSWWALALLFFGIGWLSIERSELPWITAWKLTVTPAVALAVWGSLLVPILAVGGYVRELSGGYEWFWIHLDNEHGDSSARFLAWYALSCLALLPVFLYVAALVCRYYGLPGLILQGMIWPLLILPSFGASLALTLLLSLLTRSQFWGLMAALVVVGGLIFADLDVTNLLAIAPTTIPYSTVTGFEPSRSLLCLNRAFWFLIMTLSLLLASQLIVRVQPRLSQTTSRLWHIGYSSLLVSGIVFVAGIGLAYIQEYQDIFYWGGLPPDTAWISESCSGIESYEVYATIWLESRTIQGVVRIRTASPGITIPYYMNPGLSWMPIPSQETSKIRLDHEQATFNNSESATFTMAYQGQPRLPQEFISCRSCLNSPEFHRYPFSYGWYLDQETFFLTASGDWHPFPQCPIDKLTVTLHDPPCVNGACVAQNDALIEQPRTLHLEWQPVPPGPLLAVASSYISRTVERVTVYQPAFLFPKREQDDVLRPYATTLQQLQQYGLQRDGGENLQIAILPVLRYPRYSASGLLFVPERSLLARAFTPEDTFHLFAVEQVVTAWWCYGNVCPELQQVTPFEVLLPSSVMDGSLSPNTWLVKSLVKYTSLRLITPDGVLFSENSPFFQSSLENMVADDTIFLQRLDLLYRQNPTDYWEIIRQYRETHGSQGISMQDFEHFVVAITGKPLPALSSNGETP